MRAFWMFVKNANDGAGINRPAMPPGVTGQWVIPGDLMRLTGPAGGSAHRHLLVGGIALPDDNVTGTGAGHRHYVAKLGANWTQVTVGTTAHTHVVPADGNGNLMPAWFLLFWAGSDADAALIEASPDCYRVVDALITTDEDGNPRFDELDDTAWSAANRTLWEARCLNLIGVTVPTEIDRGKRLVLLVLGALLSRQMSSERAYRFASSTGNVGTPSAERAGLSADEQAALAPTAHLAGRVVPAYTTALGAAIYNGLARAGQTIKAVIRRES